jgi:hypothetical protein
VGLKDELTMVMGEDHEGSQGMNRDVLVKIIFVVKHYILTQIYRPRQKLYYIRTFKIIK